LAKSDIQHIVNGHLDMYLHQEDLAPNKLSQVKEEDEDDVLFEPQADPPDEEAIPPDGMSEVLTSEGVVSEAGFTSEAPLSEVWTDAPLSEEPFSDAPLPEEPSSEEPFSAEPLTDVNSDMAQGD
jgi:hypothetical protein